MSSNILPLLLYLHYVNAFNLLHTLNVRSPARTAICPELYQPNQRSLKLFRNQALVNCLLVCVVFLNRHNVTRQDLLQLLVDFHNAFLLVLSDSLVLNIWAILKMIAFCCFPGVFFVRGVVLKF